MNTHHIDEHFSAYLPEHMHYGLFMYLHHGQPPGGFLKAVLANDFHNAVAHADQYNAQCFKYWAELLTIIPLDAWGSYDKVEAWCAKGGSSEHE